jgi:hypothetical protein
MSREEQKFTTGREAGRKSFWSTGSSEPLFEILKKYQIFFLKNTYL